MKFRTLRSLLVLLIVGCLLAAASLAVVLPAQRSHSSATPIETDISPGTRFGTTINAPDGPPRIDTGLVDYHGDAAATDCATCHTTRPPDLDNHADQLDEFHQGLQFAHGSLSCLACHNADDYNTLRTADGRSLPYERVIELCGQCHGTQYRDYLNGAHGGMNGHWDLTQGPRQRNNCIDCHDPHAPAFPQVQPVFPPRDRFLSTPDHPGHEEAKHE